MIVRSTTLSMTLTLCAGVSTACAAGAATPVFAQDKATLSWNIAADAGTGTVYDVVRGEVGQLPVGAGGLETCVASGVSVPTASDSTVPLPGGPFWFLVRARNACGAGIYGWAIQNGVSTVPRSTTSCP